MYHSEFPLEKKLFDTDTQQFPFPTMEFKK